MPENDFEAFEYFLGDLQFLKMFSEIRQPSNALFCQVQQCQTFVLRLEN
jgi:hypothetical protein